MQKNPNTLEIVTSICRARNYTIIKMVRTGAVIDCSAKWRYCAGTTFLAAISHLNVGHYDEFKLQIVFL